MAHIAKYKAPSCGHMLAHYTRSKDAVLERDNIDRTRTHLNYVIGHYEKDGTTRAGKVREQASWETIKKRIESVQEATGRKVRKDAVVMADMVVTAPKNVPEWDMQRFFSLSYIYLANHVGLDNMMGGYVHMDETTPHMHVPFTPIKDGKFNYKGLCPRSFYQQFHKGLGDFLESRMGYRPEIELGEERKEEKLLSAVPQAQLDQARAAVLGPLELEYEAKASALKGLRAQIAEAQAAKDEALAEAEEARRGADAESERLESLRQVNRDLAPIADGLESAAADAARFEAESREEKREILNRIARACGRAADGLSRGAEGGGDGATAIARAAGRAREAAGSIRAALAARCDSIVSRLRDMFSTPPSTEPRVEKRREEETWAERVARVKAVARRGVSEPRAGRGPQRPAASGPSVGRRR